MTSLIPIYLVFGLLIFIFLFLIFRYILLWYYRINERVKLLEENNFLLRKVCQGLGQKPEELIYPPKKG